MSKKLQNRIAVSLAAAVLLTAVAAMGFLYKADNTLADSLYQRQKALDGEVVVMGIDQYALESIGPYNTWDRSVIASALEYLNKDPDCRPAVIGVDVLYAGYGEDPDLDARLVEAAEAGGNIVFACAGEFGAELVEAGEGSYMDERSLLSFDKPYPELLSAASTGHINAMYDGDGVLRHSLLYVDIDDGQSVLSFNRVIYEMYAEHMGFEPSPLPETTDGFWYLSYSAKPGDFYEGYSVADLVNGDVDPAAFQDRIVLIGPYATGLSDYFVTAVDHAEQMYGVEVQANAIVAHITGAYKTEVGDSVQLAWLFVVTFICMLLFLDRRVVAALAIWVAVAGGHIALCKLLFEKGYVVHPLWIPLAATILFVVAVAVNYVRAALAKREVTNTFKRYVAPEIVGEILKEGTDSLGLGGKLTDIAVLFVDIRGFTTMSEVLTPPQVVEILNKYLTLTTDCVMSNKGTLDKFVGDCTMAIWNAPLPQDDYVYMACKAALDMVEGSKELSRELSENFGRTVSFGVGVHIGPAVVGNIGAEIRMDFTAIGDTVNTAARLEANAPAGKIYISRAVADALSGRINVTSLGNTIKLKGKADGFEILTLDGFTD